MCGVSWYIMYYGITKGSFPYENYNLRYYPCFFKISQDMLIFRPMSFCEFCSASKYKTSDRYLNLSRYKTSNFEKLEFLVTRKLRHFEFG